MHFLPAGEVVSIYPGFMNAFLDRELAFDETYYDLCLVLSGSSLRGPRGETATELWKPLADDLKTSVTLRAINSISPATMASSKRISRRRDTGNRWYHPFDCQRFACKRQHSVLGRPEATLNPKLIKLVADFLLRLAAAGIQVFIATHDYLLSTELSLQSE